MNRTKIYILMLLMAVTTFIGRAETAGRSAVWDAGRGVQQVVAKADFAVGLTLRNFDDGYDPTEALQHARYSNCTFVSVSPLSQSTNTSVISGVATVTKSVYYRVVFRANGKGECKIGPINFDGVQSNNVSLTAVSAKQMQKQSQQKQQQNKIAKDERPTFYIVPYISSSTAQVGESLEYELRLLYSTEANISNTSISVVQEPEFKGFDAVPCRLYGTPTGSMEYKGKRYGYTVVGKWLLTPLREKTLVVRSGDYTLHVVPVGIANGFFGPEYVPDYQRQYDVSLKGSAIRVKVKGYKVPDKKTTTPKQPERTIGNDREYSI